MVIWKAGTPYIVREIDDLREVIGEEVFEPVKKFIDEQIEQSDTVSKLEDEIDTLESEVMELEGEVEEVTEALEDLKERQQDYAGLVEKAKDFLESIDSCTFNKDQWYYLDQLQDAVNRSND